MTSEPYEGEVGRTSEVAMLCSFVQLDKAIPLLLDMRDDLKAVRKTSDATLDEVRTMRKTTDATLEEIKGMREDIQPGYASNFRRMQSDIRAIKERLGMP